MMLSADEARQLDRLAIAAGTASASAGRRATRARGDSVEFHDFRPYQPGDDPRSIDWTVEARLGQLVVRRFRALGNVPLHLLIDTSASMGAGSPSKLAAAARAAAAFAYVAALRRDPIGVVLFDETVTTHIATGSGRGQLFRALDALASADASGRSGVDPALTRYGSAVRGPGLAIVLSDFFDPALTLDGLRFLLYRGLSVAVVQVLADEEIDPPVDDDMELVDIENPSMAPLVVSSGVLPAYRARLIEATAALQSFCHERAAPFIRLVSSDSFGAFVSNCTRAGLLEPHS